MARLAARLGGGADRDDLVQEALTRAWRRRETFDPGRGTPRTWLLAIVADQARKARRRRRPEVATNGIDAAVAPGDGDRVAAITGWLTTSQGVGAVIGALAIAPLAARFGRRRMLLFNVFATPVAVTAYAVVATTPLAIVLLGVVGMLYIGVLSGLNNVVSLWAPTALRGRILSLYLVSLGAIYPIGGLVQGWVADRIGLTETTTLGAAALVLAVGLWQIARPDTLRPLTDPEELGVDPENLATV
jgi:MFS family permease